MVNSMEHVEKQRLIEIGKGMDDGQKRVIIRTFSSDILLDELKKREEITSGVLAKVFSILNDSSDTLASKEDQIRELKKVLRV